mgnify:CR=1 FL=1
MNTLRNEVRRTIAEVARDAGREINQIEEADLLRETLGLDSLDLAVVVVRLEQKLGIDPFRVRQRSLRTVGDLISAYEEILQNSP